MDLSDKSYRKVFLQLFFNRGCLVNLQTFDGPTAKDLVINLVHDRNEDGAACLELLADKLPKFKANEAKDLVINLASANVRIACLAPLLDKLPIFEADVARDLVEELASGWTEQKLILEWLVKNGKLVNLSKLEGSAAQEFIIALAGKQNGRYFLQPLLEAGKLNNLTLSADEANRVAFALIEAGDWGKEILTLLREKGLLLPNE
jgi:hypothetical protein